MASEDKCSDRKRSLLIAEDDEDDRMIYEEILKGFTKCVDFEFVENGRELIERLNAQDSLPDLILLDLNMPLMDGRQALKAIRSDPKLKDIPVVCITTSTSHEDIRFCQDQRAGFYTKPAAIAEFSGLVHSQIRRSHASSKAVVQ
jgi:CheY-like chemotaxis protein